MVKKLVYNNYMILTVQKSTAYILSHVYIYIYFLCYSSEKRKIVCIYIYI